MARANRFYLSVIVAIIAFSVASCTPKPTQTTIATILPATSHVEITFDERQIAEQCRVFAHLLIAIPANLSEIAIKEEVERYAMENGADYVLVGFVRENLDDPETMTFTSYGPSQPYLFTQQWAGWKFGIRDWNRGGQLVDYGYDRMKREKSPFDMPVTVQALLLTCQIGPLKQ